MKTFKQYITEGVTIASSSPYRLVVLYPNSDTRYTYNFPSQEDASAAKRLIRNVDKFKKFVEKFRDA